MIVSVFDSLSFISILKHSLLCFESITNGKKISPPLAALSLLMYVTAKDEPRLKEIADYYFVNKIQ